MEMTWGELVRRYAIQAREFSDSVAVLGQETHLAPEACRGSLETIRAKLRACIAAADEIERYSREYSPPCFGRRLS